MSLVLTNNQKSHETLRFWIDMFESKKAPRLAPIIDDRRSVIQPKVSLNQSVVSPGLNLKKDQDLLGLDEAVIPQVVNDTYSCHSEYDKYYRS